MILLHILWIIIKILLILLASILGLILLVLLILLFCPFGYEMAFSKPNPEITDLKGMRFSAHVSWLLGILRVGIVRTDDGMRKTLQIFGKYLMGKPEAEKESEKKADPGSDQPKALTDRKASAEKKEASEKKKPEAAKPKTETVQEPEKKAVKKKVETKKDESGKAEGKKAESKKAETKKAETRKAEKQEAVKKEEQKSSEENRSRDPKGTAKPGTETKKKTKDKVKAQEIKVPAVTEKTEQPEVKKEPKKEPKIEVHPKEKAVPEEKKKAGDKASVKQEEGSGQAKEDSRNLIGRMYDAFFGIFEKIFSVPEKMQDKIEHFEDRVDQTEEKIEKLLHRIGWYKDFVMHECSKRLIRKILKCVGKLIRHLSPRRLSGELRFSTEDPDLTGMILAFMGMTIPFHKNRVLLQPGFEEVYTLSGEVQAKGRIVIGYLLGSVLGAVLNRDMWNVFQRWRKKEGLNG